MPSCHPLNSNAKFSMSASEQIAAWREFVSPRWIAAGLVAELLLWFGWMYPLVPITTLGWMVAVVSGILVGLCAALCVSIILWLQRQKKFVWLCRIAGVVVAVSLGLGIFTAAYSARDFFGQNLSYFGK